MVEYDKILSLDDYFVKMSLAHLGKHLKEVKRDAFFFNSV